MNGANLVRYDAMCSAIAVCYEVDEVKDIRDKAIAIEAYAKQAMNTDAERKATEIRIRAERKCGQLLKEKARTPAEERNPEMRVSSHGEAIPSEYAEAKEKANISRTQAERWQKLAEVPDKQFEEVLGGPEKPSTSGIIRATKPRPVVVMPTTEESLWVLGRLRDFEKHPAPKMDLHTLVDDMTDGMVADALRIAPMVIDYFTDLLEVLHEEQRH